jgi:hypothetical protein
MIDATADDQTVSDTPLRWQATSPLGQYLLPRVSTGVRRPGARSYRTGVPERWETPSRRPRRRGYRRRSARRSRHRDTDLRGKNRHLPERWAKPCGFGTALCVAGSGAE